MIRILVTGTQGQVARALAERAACRPEIDLTLLGRPEIDLAQPASVGAAIMAAKPDIVVNAAAHTAVDQAEDEPEQAYTINALGAEAVAKAAVAIGVPVIQISTDYVFDGSEIRPYKETDPVGPSGVYGRTKLAGERLVAAANPHHVIMRTARVYSPFGKNFIKTMLGLAETRDQLDVVADQFGNPTSAYAIAEAILAVTDRVLGAPPFTDWGIYHFAGAQEVSWAGFAKDIFCISNSLGGPSALVRPITTKDYPTKAPRPSNSRLDTNRFLDVFGFEPGSPQEHLLSAVSALLNQRSDLPR